MSIAEKLTQIAENQQAVYDAGYADGQKAEYDRLVDETKIIEKTVTGSAIRVDDVSEIPHKCTVSVDEDASVTVCGKNIWDEQWENGGINTLSSQQGTTRYGSLNNSATAVANSIRSKNFIPVKAGVPLRIQVPQMAKVVSYDTDKQGYAISYITSNAFTPQQNGYIKFVIGGTVGTTTAITEYGNNICISINNGSKAVYEPYNGTTHALTAGQLIEVDSICPTMTLFTDNDATITFGYHKSYGAQKEYDRFWDGLQLNGDQTDYRFAFAGTCWTANLLKPKYNIKPVNAYSMFGYSGTNIDLAQHFDNLGIELDFTNCTNMYQLAYYSSITRFGKILFSSNIAELSAAFDNATALVTIDEFGTADGSEIPVSLSNTFRQCKALQNITIKGIIGVNVSFQHSPLLTTDSVQSIIDHLKDLTEETTQTLTFHATVGAALTDAQKAAITAKNWTLAY